MTPDEFSGFLKSRSIVQTNIARKRDVSLSQVNNVVRGYSKSPRVRKFIAEELNEPVENIDWPLCTRCNNTIMHQKNKIVKK